MKKAILDRRAMDISVSILFIGVFGCLVSLLGFFAGGYLWIYLIPPWTSVEIDTKGRVFEEIVAYDIVNYRDMELVDVEVIFGTNSEEYFSYYQDVWELTSPPLSEGRGLYFQENPRPCKKLDETPPFVFFQNVKDSVHVFMTDTATTTTIDWCYVLKENGALHQWTRRFTLDDLLYMVVGSMLVGFVIGGLIGRRMKTIILQKIKVISTD